MIHLLTVSHCVSLPHPISIDCCLAMSLCPCQTTFKSLECFVDPEVSLPLPLSPCISLCLLQHLDVSLIRIRQQDARLQPPHDVVHPGEAHATPRVEPPRRLSCPPGPDIICLSLVTPCYVPLSLPGHFHLSRVFCGHRSLPPSTTVPLHQSLSLAPYYGRRQRVSACLCLSRTLSQSRVGMVKLEASQSLSRTVPV